MRVLLVKPNTELLAAKRLERGFLHLEPLELEIVAGGVPKADDVRILDLSVEDDPEGAFSERLHSFAPHLVGFTGYSTTSHIVKRLARVTKTHSPETLTVVGGIHATLRPADYATEHIDLVVRGEGGSAIRGILRRLAAGDSPHSPPTVLSTKEADFAMAAAAPPPPYPPVEKIPAPRRDLVDRNQYYCVWTTSETRRLPTMFPRVASLRTSLGCPFSCSFCVIHHVMNGKYLQRTPEDVVADIKALAEEHIYFVDDEMFVNAERVGRIAELLAESGVRKRYVSWARSDTIVKHPELFRKWREVGLDTVYVGLESISDTALAEYGKRINVETNNRAVAILKDLGIMLHAALIVRPDFTVQDFRDLEATIRDLSPAEITFTVLSPSPATKMWQEQRDRFICDPFRYYDCMHTLVPTKLPLRRFYQHFGRLNALALRANPLRLNRVRVPLRELLRAIVRGTRYIFSLYLIYKDYPPTMWLEAGDELLEKRELSQAPE